MSRKMTKFDAVMALVNAALGLSDDESRKITCRLDYTDETGRLYVWLTDAMRRATKVSP
jgi:hypothetical protein